MSLFYLVILLALSNLALGYTAPSTLSTFHPVLERAKLQAPESNTAASDLFGYSDWFFHLQDETYIQFQMNGKDKRSELRQMQTDGDEADWSVTSSNTMTAEIALPTPAPSMDEISFLQVHCDAAPALRISWRKSWEEFSDVVIANLRDGLGDDDVNKYFLAQRSASTTSYQVSVKNSRVTVWIGGTRVLDESMSFWESYSCYFKAGVYIQNPDSETDRARTKFKELSWP